MDDGAVKALELMRKLATSGVTAPSLSNAKEQAVQLGFQSPDSEAAFELNWPFVFPAMKKVATADGAPQAQKDRAEHFKWVRYPSVIPGEPSKTTIGGFDLGVSQYSRNKPEAFEAALCLRNEKHQKFSALNDGAPPTLESIYTDDSPLDPSQPASDDNPTMGTAYPMRDAILAGLKDAGVRPLTPVYQNASTVMSKLLSPPSAIDPSETAAELREQLQLALESKGVLP